MELAQAQISEIIREQASSPSGFNHLVELLLDSFMQHERSLYLSSHERDSGNGFRPRRFCYGQYEFSFKVPRSRQDHFYLALLAVTKREDEERVRLFTSLYIKDLTTEQIGKISEEIYGKHYTNSRLAIITIQ